MEEIIEKDTFRDVFQTSKRAIAFAWKKERKLLVINLLLVIFLAAIVYVQLSSFSNIVNEIVRIQENHLGITHILIKQTIILGLSFLFPSFLQNLQATIFSSLRTKMITHSQLILIDSFSALDVGTIQGSDFQEKYDRAQRWGLSSIMNVLQNGFQVIQYITGFVTSGFILFFINPYLVLLAILGSIAYYFVENKYGVQLFRLQWTNSDANRIEDDRYSHFKDMRKIVEVLLFDLRNFFRSHVKKLAQEYDRELIIIQGKKSWATFGADFIQTVCLFIAVALVTILTLRGKLLIGSLLLAFTVYRSFVSTSESFFQGFSQLEEQTRFAKRWFDIFEVRAKIVSKPHALKPLYERPPRIEFKNVSFQYPDTTVVVLKNVSLTLESGEKLAIVGLNGAGKTTLIRLLCRVYDPTEGQILIDGIDLRNINLDSWREYLGVLFQDFTNYQMTVREAIAISRPNEPIDDEKVKVAAELSGAQDFIQEFPKKYEQLVWKGFKDGVELSKGQFQRMAVARIFYRDALISVLDEPTSAIDAVAEEKIFEVLETKMKGKTVVLISHRFSTVKNADKIAVIEHGELKELGSHKDLMKKNGRYAELYTMQAKRYLESE